MGEHKQNDRALFEASVPSLMPMGEKTGISVDMYVLPQPHILLLKTHQWRTNDLGWIEINTEGTGGEWKPIEKEQEVFELGKQLPANKCDVVFMVSSIVQARSSVFTPGRADRSTSNVPHFPLGRIPLDVWRAEHEANLGHRVESQLQLTPAEPELLPSEEVTS
jgi:hypothetical protein